MGSEWIIIAVIGVILLFSAKKLPDMARGLGQSMRIFKAETRSLREDGEKDGQAGAPPAVEGGPTAPGRVAGDGTSAGSSSSTPTGGTSGGSETSRPVEPGDGSRSGGSGA